RRLQARSPVQGRHAGFRITGAERGAWRQDLVEATQLVLAQGDVDCAYVLLETREAPRARNRHDALIPREHPRERELCGSAAFVLGDVVHGIDELEIAAEILALEARVLASPVIGCEIVDAADRTREEAAAERAVGDEA